VDPEAAPAQRHADRVDQERHVVGDDLERGVRRLPAVDLELRIEDADLALARLALAAEVQVRERRAVEVDARLAREILRGDPAVVLADELLRLTGVGLRQMLVKPGTDGVYEGFIERLPDSRAVFVPRLMSRFPGRAARRGLSSPRSFRGDAQ
jgi:hypothetical protein